MRRRARTLLLAVPAILLAILLVLLTGETGFRSAPEPTPVAPPPVGPLPPNPLPPRPAPAGVESEEKEPGPATSSLPAGTVAGRVFLEGEATSGGVVIRIARYEDPGDDPDLPNWFETVTAADGSFRLDGLPPGRYGLSARPPDRDLGLRRLDFVLPEGAGAGPIEIVWPAGGSILVDLGAGADTPRKGERVRLDRQYGSGSVSGFRYAKSDAEGKVVFTRLEPGEYAVDWNGRSLPVTVVGGRETRVVFEGTCWFRGTLTGPDGRPLAKAVVRLGVVYRKGQKYRSVECESGADGSFGVESAAPGDYNLTVQVLGRRGWATSMGRTTLADGETVTVDLRVPDTAISGRITRAGSGDPVLSGEVQVSAHAVEGDANAMAFCDERGRYAFVGLPPGRYRIWIAPLRIPVKEARREVTLPESGRLEGVDFVLEPR